MRIWGRVGEVEAEAATRPARQTAATKNLFNIEHSSWRSWDVYRDPLANHQARLGAKELAFQNIQFEIRPVHPLAALDNPPVESKMPSIPRHTESRSSLMEEHMRFLSTILT